MENVKNCFIFNKYVKIIKILLSDVENVRTIFLMRN